MDDQGITYNSDGVAQPYQVKPGGSWDDFGRMITHAIHHGFAAGYDDEAGAAARAFGQYLRGEPGTYNENYDKFINPYRDQADALQKSYPWTTLGTSVAAGAALPLGSFGLAAKGAGWGRAALSGAGIGAR